jgi:hypothetical protein
MLAQLDSKAICKRSKKEEMLPNFHRFWSEEVQCEKDIKKRNL